jgi:hypothetical protein
VRLALVMGMLRRQGLGLIRQRLPKTLPKAGQAFWV